MELQIIKNKIYEIRGCRVMLDFDLAELYEVETRTLKQAVRRNIERFPDDFMFELSEKEWQNLTSQLVMSSHGGVRYMPFAFTQEGVAMLASVLRNSKAIQVNIEIVRAFVKLRAYANELEQLNEKLESFMLDTNIQFGEIYQALTELASKEEVRKKELAERSPIGFKRKES